MRDCKIIAIEGADKVGKATQSKMLAVALAQPFQYVLGITTAYSVVRVEIPTRTCRWTHKLIYMMLSNGWAKRVPNVFQFVQFLNRLAFALFELPGLVASNDYIVFDRWNLSSFVYGTETGCNKYFIKLLLKMVPQADLTLVLTGDPHHRDGADSYESDTGLQQRVRALYFAIGASTAPEFNKFVLVHNGGNRDEVHARVMCVLRHAGMIR